MEAPEAKRGAPIDRGDESPRDAGKYEPPRVERVLTPAGLEEEILYAGIVIVTLHT